MIGQKVVITVTAEGCQTSCFFAWFVDGVTFAPATSSKVATTLSSAAHVQAITLAFGTAGRHTVEVVVHDGGRTQSATWTIVVIAPMPATDTAPTGGRTSNVPLIPLATIMVFMAALVQLCRRFA